MVGKWKFIPPILLSLTLMLLVPSVNASTLVEAFTSIKKQTLEYASRYYLDGKAHLSSSQQRDIECLAKVMFFEARGEVNRGKRFVANVVQNRVEHGKPFATNVCAVVYQKHQFSWTNERWKRDISFLKIKNKYKNERKQVEEITKIALEIVILGEKPTVNYLFFSTGNFSFGGLKFEEKVGNHKFYSLK